MLHLFARRAIKLAVGIVAVYYCYQLRTKFYPISSLTVFTPFVDEIIGDRQ
jgi:hypothetical protein